MTSRVRDTYTSLAVATLDPESSWRRPSPATPAILAEPAPEPGFGGSVRCLACAHRCLIRPGRQGICHVRENRDGTLVSLVYGQLVAAAAEPIEKKPLFHAWPGSVAYSVSTRGCNFHCRFCQNWTTSQADVEELRLETLERSPEDVVRRAVAAGARSIAYTYVEPTVFIEFVVDTARLAHEAGLANVLVTNGYQTPEALAILGPLIDAANVDLKSFSDWFYRRVCGARLAPVLATLREMRARGIWLEVTTLVIDGLNDEPSDLELIAEWIERELGQETPWHVSRAYPAYLMPDLRPTPVDSIRRAVGIGLAAGLQHVYAGNLGDRQDQDTRCATCRRTLIRRRAFGVVATELQHGSCPSCGTALPGIGLWEGVA